MHWLPLLSRSLVALGYLGFFAVFFLRKRPAETETRRERVSILGIALQMVSFSVVWLLQRRMPAVGSPLAPAEIALDVLAPVLSAIGAWTGYSALQTLGRQWSYAARLVEEHRLVTQGPYAIVRHPIYAAMFAKLLAANFAFGHWLGLVIGVPIFIAGTMIRIGSEEKLLRGAFGAQYGDYARRVKAFIPLVL